MSVQGYVRGRTRAQRRGGLVTAVMAVVFALAFLVAASPARAATVGTYEDGSAGFFEWLGEDEAAKLVRDALKGTVRNEKNPGRNIGSYQTTSPDSLDSAFNLDNMRDSLEIIDKCNALRVKHAGCTVLYVDPSLMAISQILTNYSASTNDHASVFNVGENLTGDERSFTIDQSFSAQYDAEKKLWESSEYNEVRNWFNGYKAQHGFNDALNELAEKYPAAFHEVGHYLNIINTDYKYAGSAIAWDNFYVQEQSFDRYVRGEKTYTVAAFRDLLDEYLDLVGGGSGDWETGDPLPGTHKINIVMPPVGGTVEYYKGEYRFPGDEIQISIQVFPGFVLDDIVVDGVVYYRYGKYANDETMYYLIFDMPDNDVTIFPAIRREDAGGNEKYKVSVASASHGRVSVDRSEAPYGWLVNVTATPDAGYKVGTFTVTDASGKSVPTGGKNGEMYFLMPESNVTVKVTFVPDEELTITYAKPAHGRVTVDPSTGVKAGDRVTVALWPDNLYVVKSVKVTNVSTGASVSLSGSGATRFFIMPDASVKLEATFESMFGEDDSDTIFPDVAANAWYAGPVEWAVENGVMSGYANGTFGPNDKLMRQDMAVVLYRYLGGREGAPSCGLSDVDQTYYYKDAINWCVQGGIISGYGDGTFGVGDPITREQLAVVLYRLEGSPRSTGSLSKYPDGSRTSAFARDAMEWAVGEGLISGYSNGLLGPTDSVNRAMAVTIIQRWANSR